MSKTRQLKKYGTSVYVCLRSVSGLLCCGRWFLVSNCYYVFVHNNPEYEYCCTIPPGGGFPNRASFKMADVKPAGRAISNLSDFPVRLLGTLWRTVDPLLSAELVFINIL
jgi:hypothetical protein